jgi:hypothetical protein
METALAESDSAALARLARRYIWWQPPEEAVRNLHRLMAQVMNLGTSEDARAMRAMIGDEALRRVLAEASPGEFSDRSWHYWHQMLGEKDPVEVPPLPKRTFDSAASLGDLPSGSSIKTPGGVFAIALKLDLLGHKLKVLMQRIEP